MSPITAKESKMRSVTELLTATGAPSAKFPEIGSTVTGIVVSTYVRQAKDYSTDELEFWTDGNPKEIIVIIVQTDTLSDDIPDDDGTRAIYVKAWKPWLGAFRTGCAGSIPIAGDLFTATFTSLGTALPKMEAPKLFTYSLIAASTDSRNTP